MRPKKLVSYGIPLLVMLLGVCATILVNLLVVTKMRESRRITEDLERATKEAASLAGMAAKATSSAPGSLLDYLSYEAEDVDLKYAAVVGPDLKVLAAAPSGWTSRPLSGTGAADSEQLVRKVQAGHLPAGMADNVREVAIAVHPVKSTPLADGFVVAVVERDLSRARELAHRGAFKDSMVFGGALLAAAIPLWLMHGRSLRAREDRLREAKVMQDRMADLLGAALITTRDDCIESVNSAGVSLCGAKSPDQMLGRSPFDFFHKDTQQLVRDLMRTTQQHGATAAKVEGRIVRVNGGEVDVKISAVPARIHQEPGVQLILTDMTDQRERDASRAALSRDLEEKNRELEAIVYAASHDLRSPLLNVMGFSHQLTDACSEIQTITDRDSSGADATQLKKAVGTTVPRALKFIEQGVTKMDTLISGFLQYSRSGRQEIDARELDMNALLKSTAESLAFQFQQSGTELRIEMLPTCRGDAMQIAQVFTNLLDNAMKYRRPDVPCIISVQGHRTGSNSVYTVADNGVGIAPEHQQRIFDIFHRLDPSVCAGEGLGLTIARRIVQRHGGSISVESQPGAGSTFTVILPT